MWIETASKDGSLHVSVCDTGIGIAEENLISIFDKFYQIKDTKTGGHEGTGLGLPITKHLVELHGGTISVKSRLGQGTRFELIFPLSQTQRS